MHDRLGFLGRGDDTQTGGDHGDAQLVFHAFVEHGTADHGGLGRRVLADGLHHLLVLLEAQGTAGGDVDQHAAGARQFDSLEQRTGHRPLGGDAGAIDPGGDRGTHHGLAHLVHHRAHVLKVDVDQARHVDDLGDAAHGVAQHVVRRLECFEVADLLAKYFLEFLVEDHDQRIDVLGQLGYALFRHALAPALVFEGLGHHRHGQDAEVLGHLGHHRTGTGAGAAAHAGRDEDHVRAAQRIGDAFAILHGQLAGLFRLAAGAKSRAELQLDVRGALLQRLRIGVAADEFDTADALANHVIDRVAAGAADTDHLDHRRVGLRFLPRYFLKFKHFRLLKRTTTSKIPGKPRPHPRQNLLEALRTLHLHAPVALRHPFLQQTHGRGVARIAHVIAQVAVVIRC